jgi:hypothetical protein
MVVKRQRLSGNSHTNERHGFARGQRSTCGASQTGPPSIHGHSVPLRFADPGLIKAMLAARYACGVAICNSCLIPIAQISRNQSSVLEFSSKDRSSVGVAMRKPSSALLFSIVATILFGHLMISPSSGQTRRPIMPHRTAITASSTNQPEGDENLTFDFEHARLESVLGKEVRTRVEEDGGRIIDLLADQSGQVVAAVIEFGGFLGIGTRKIAVEWSALRFENRGNTITVDVTRDQLRAAPEFKPSEPIVVHRTFD